jgi:hypothetical protein
MAVPNASDMRWSQRELPKAAEQLQQIGAYFTSRVGGTPNAASRPHLEHFLEQVVSLAELVAGELDRAGIPRLEQPSAVPDAPDTSGQFDTGRVQRFTDHLEQMFAWFGDRTGSPLRAEGRDSMQRLHGSLEALTVVVSTILGRASSPSDTSTRRLAPVDPAPLPGSEPQPAPTASPPSPARRGGSIVRERGRASERTPASATDRMPLVASAADPVVAVAHHGLHLTASSAARLRSFAETNGLHLEGHTLTRMGDKVAKWFASTPGGQVLELRISHLQGHPQLYPSYVSRWKDDRRRR